MCSLCLNKSNSSEHTSADEKFSSHVCLDHQNSSNIIFKATKGEILIHPTLHALSLEEPVRRVKVQWQNDNNMSLSNYCIKDPEMFSFEGHSVCSNTFTLCLGVGGIHFLRVFMNTEVAIKTQITYFTGRMKLRDFDIPHYDVIVLSLCKDRFNTSSNSLSHS